MWTVTTQSPASGKGQKHIKVFRSLILPTTSPIIKLSFHLKLTLESSDRVSAIPTFESIFILCSILVLEYMDTYFYIIANR